MVDKTTQMQSHTPTPSPRVRLDALEKEYGKQLNDPNAITPKIKSKGG